MVNYFEEEFIQLSENIALMQSRKAISDSLKACSPLAAELFAIEMQAEGMESARREANSDGLLGKIWQVLKNDGFGKLVKKIITKVLNKLLNH